MIGRNKNMDRNYELILFLLSKHYPNKDFEEMDEFEVYNWFYDHYGVTDEQFDDLITDLLPLCSEGVSPLTEKRYRGFACYNIWLLNKEIK